MPGNVYDFKLFESNQLIWDYAIITEPAIPEYINMAELSPGMLKITFYLLITLEDLLLSTVFPHIVSAETILFCIWKSKSHST